MKKYNYLADGGAIQLGNEDFVCHYMNNYGDGYFEIFVIEKNEKSTKDYEFVGSVEGTFNVYGYDCDKSEILTTLTGRYGVYAKNGTIILKEW